MSTPSILQRMLQRLPDSPKCSCIQSRNSRFPLGVSLSTSAVTIQRQWVLSSSLVPQCLNFVCIYKLLKITIVHCKGKVCLFIEQNNTSTLLFYISYIIRCFDKSVKI